MPQPDTPLTTSAKTRSLHDQLLRKFHGFIVSQEWPPGFQLPFETDLAQAHGVSRMTMNKVLTQLTREGYLIRRRKLGTFVAQPRAQSAVMELTDVEAEVRALGLPWRFQLLSRGLRAPADHEIREARITAPGKVLALRGLHFAGDQPFCLEERIINPAAAPTAPDQDFTREAPGHWLRQEIPWTSAENRIRAVNAGEQVARDLALSPGEACLELTRRTEIAGQWVTLVRQSYPGDRHQLLAQFEPRPEAAHSAISPAVAD
ncbi:UTRA domain-containing protein [Xinfangfangia sp. D13-10-4-6]|uniref:UTRA domain-containing protein n=1 Tax=Pseudogemmobacter hezensis TaxID=2737662 RepID=UPI001554E409|nr:UTRA domain-containing protein [Pseudogemmobacter hezensis]NPD17012.1 UTRA domain-containing protein [Pseudogemmobacter hezensis]